MSKKQAKAEEKATGQAADGFEATFVVAYRVEDGALVFGKAEVIVRDKAGVTRARERAQMCDAKERRGLYRAVAGQLGMTA
jgi:hypothetical protein